MRNNRHLILIFSIILISWLSSPVMSQDSANLSGYIAYIGDDYNVYTIHPSNLEVNTVTEDATRSRHFLWPTWANDGRLAYFCCDPAASGRPEIEVYVSPMPGASGELVYAEQNQVFTYAYWSPSDCEAIDNCRDIAVLVTSLNPQGLLLQIIRNDAVTNDSWTVERGAPFYFTWNRDGNRIVWLRNDSVYEIYDPTSRQVQDHIQLRPGRGIIPIWSSVDDRIFLPVRNSDGRFTDVVTLAGDESEPLIAAHEGAISFLISPDGRFLAYRSITANGVGNVIVIDTVSGSTITESPFTGVAAFFWSPDSRSIAYITLADQPGTFSAKQLEYIQQEQPIQLMWHVLDVETGQNRTLQRFAPTNDMVYLLTFFEQFAHSHHIWSPDSTHIVYSEATRFGNGVIRILDVTSDASQPITIANGQIGIWSFE